MLAEVVWEDRVGRLGRVGESSWEQHTIYIMSVHHESDCYLWLLGIT